MGDQNEQEDLPIMKYREEIVSKVKNNPVTLIFGGNTGCGKSTRIPQFIMDSCKRETCNILVTQPRKIAAITIAKRVASERKCELGSTVGFQVGLMKKLNKLNHETKLLFCTTGVLLEKIIYGKSIDHFSHIILDEIHERNLDIDLVMTVIREYLLLGTCDTKLILMSATLNPTKFQEYFTLKFNDVDYAPAVVQIEPEKKFSIEINYLDDLPMFRMSREIVNISVPSITKEMYHLAADIIKIHLEESTKSILVFLPGIYEIDTLHSVLTRNENIKERCMIFVLHSSLPTDQQKEAFMRGTLPKVILSTNLAESSVTIPDIECVIDFCLTKNLVNEDSSISALKLELASKNSCVQRAGRTGRVCNGRVYRLIYKRDYTHALLEENIPEMQRAPLENVFLRVKLLEIEAPVPFLSKCISPPEIKAIVKAVLKLKELYGLKLFERDGSFVPYDGRLTFVGKLMASLPIDVQLSKLIMLGYMFSILEEIIIIAAGLYIRNVFRIEHNNKFKNYINKIKWANGTCCDALAILNAYLFWQHEREKGTLSKYEVEQKFCNDYGLDRKNLHEMRLLIMKIQDRLKAFKLEPLTGEKALTWSAQEKILIIKICLAGAFLPNTFIKGKSDEIQEREVYKSLMGFDYNNSVYFRKMDRDQLGIVYAERIKDKLVEYGIANSKEGIKVAFDSSKVFVQFNDRKSMIDDESYDEKKLRNDFLFPGSIANEVYRAVKFRKTGGDRKSIGSRQKRTDNADDDYFNASFEFDVLPVSETREYAREQNILDFVRGIYQAKKILCTLPEHIYLPSYNTKEMFGWISHVEHCNKFYFQTVMDENSSVLTDIEMALKDEEGLKPAKNLKAEKLVIAFHGDYYKRAKIVSIYEKSADCYFFDYGYTIEMKLGDIFELDEEKTRGYFLIFERCFECRLTEIAPSYVKCPRGKWTKEAIEDFSDKVLNKFCKILVHSVVHDIASVQLISGKQNMNEYLVSKGYARNVREPYINRLNRIERDNVQSSVTEWITREVEFKEKESNIVKISVPPPRGCKKTIRLDGPYSPLETHIYELSIKSLGQIQIDPQSVNSIVLDHDVANYNGTLIVAAEVMKSANRGLMLYNVSTFPDIFALPTLLAMMFAPNIMIHTEGRKCIGLRFGLGCSEKTFRSYNFDNDRYLPFNYEEELQDDVQDINHLRYSMSTLLEDCPNEEDGLNEEQKAALMEDIKNVTLKILQKKRTPTEPSPFIPDRTDNWKCNNNQTEQLANDKFKGGPYRSIQLPTFMQENEET